MGYSPWGHKEPDMTEHAHDARGKADGCHSCDEGTQDYDSCLAGRLPALLGLMTCAAVS